MCVENLKVVLIAAVEGLLKRFVLKRGAVRVVQLVEVVVGKWVVLRVVVLMLRETRLGILVWGRGTRGQGPGG